MATFIDEGDESQQDEEEYSSIEDEEEQETPEQEPEPQDTEDDIPDKYKGKSVKDIVRMHQEAERAIGKQGSEVGELRRIVDDFVQAQTVSQKQQAPEVEEEVDFFTDPDKAIASAISKHPKVREAEQLSAQMKKAEALANLKSAHPDFTEVVNDGSFSEWINKSKVRQELFSRADRSYDFDAANELLSTWKERKQVVNQSQAVEKVQRKQAVKAASTGSSKGSGETASKKTYRRADIIELMRTNPDRYQAACSDELWLHMRRVVLNNHFEREFIWHSELITSPIQLVQRLSLNCGLMKSSQPTSKTSLWQTSFPKCPSRAKRATLCTFLSPLVVLLLSRLHLHK
jgi:hypothetical protein